MDIFSSTVGREANFRMSIELIVAIRSFDRASANLITTSNKLQNRILTLTYAVVGLGLISVIPAVRDLISRNFLFSSQQLTIYTHRGIPGHYFFFGWARGLWTGSRLPQRESRNC